MSPTTADLAWSTSPRYRIGLGQRRRADLRGGISNDAIAPIPGLPALAQERGARSLTVKIRRERALLILKCRERADVVNAALLVKRRHRFSSNYLAA